jgi:uncharacterized protein (UPF0248 family)
MSSDSLSISMSGDNQTMASDRIIYIKMLSGDIITILLKRFYGLFMLKREIMNYLIYHMGQDITTNEIILMDMEENKELRDYPNSKVKLKDGGMYYLFIRNRIKYEKINFIYTSRGIELYRFTYVSNDNYMKQNTFSVRIVSENRYEYSMNFQLSFLTNNECNWYSSIKEMLINHLNNTIIEESLDNLCYLWDNKHLIDRDMSHMEI